jgi:hypothetical protein
LARASDRRGFAVGLAAVVLGYSLVFPVRAWIASYEQGILQNSRYQLLPQMGLVWFVAESIHGAEWSRPTNRSELSTVQVLGLAAMAAALYGLHRTQV